MGGGSEGEKRGGRPTKEERDRVREERPHPTEVSFYIPVAVEPRITFSGKRAGQEDCEEKEDDPANLARLMAQLPGLIYAQRDREIFVNLFIGSTVMVANVAGTDVEMVQATEYPWSGKVGITVNPLTSKR